METDVLKKPHTIMFKLFCYPKNWISLGKKNQTSLLAAGELVGVIRAAGALPITPRASVSSRRTRGCGKQLSSVTLGVTGVLLGHLLSLPPSFLCKIKGRAQKGRGSGSSAVPGCALLRAVPTEAGAGCQPPLAGILPFLVAFASWEHSSRI